MLAFPNVIGEAMAGGTPSVATDVENSAWIIGDTGKVVPRGNIQALAEGVTDLLILGEPRALGRARARIKEEFEIGKLPHSTNIFSIWQTAAKSCAG